MAQNEDTELRDLVIDALEKNGSLAKIRALLRANIFLAFEDECHLKQNEELNKILNIPEGELCLSIIHEFLDFCNLRNTLFVYKSETRQGKEYEYQNENLIADKLCISKSDRAKEPILLSLIKNSLNLSSKSIFKQNDIHSKGQSKVKRNFGSDENCTYIVHEDSSTTSQSQSDNSSDEKNKLDLRLQLDNSDTDTSSSSKCKSSSEYIPNKNITIEETNDKINIPEQIINLNQVSSQKNSSYINKKSPKTYLHDLKLINNSSDSTSYAELKPFNSIDTILLNTTGLPLSTENVAKQVSPPNSTSSKIESLSLNQTMDSNSETLKKESQHSNKSINSFKKILQTEAGENDATEYSYDFTSPLSERKEISETKLNIQDFLHVNTINKSDMSTASPKQNSFSSQSSVSISDVADLISETSSKIYSLDKNISDKSKLSSHKFNKSPKDSKILSDDSGDFSESPIPSLSNLSLDIHSE